MSNIDCPVCGAELDVYLQSEPEDTTTNILVKRQHSDEVECKRGCEEISRSYWVAYCSECDSEIGVLDEYVSPCSANGYSVELQVFEPGRLTGEMVDLWLSGEGLPEETEAAQRTN